MIRSRQKKKNGNVLPFPPGTIVTKEKTRLTHRFKTPMVTLKTVSEDVTIVPTSDAQVLQSTLSTPIPIQRANSKWRACERLENNNFLAPAKDNTRLAD